MMAHQTVQRPQTAKTNTSSTNKKAYMSRDTWLKIDNTNDKKLWLEITEPTKKLILEDGKQRFNNKNRNSSNGKRRANNHEMDTNESDDGDEEEDFDTHVEFEVDTHVTEIQAPVIEKKTRFVNTTNRSKPIQENKKSLLELATAHNPTKDGIDINKMLSQTSVYK